MPLAYINTIVETAILTYLTDNESATADEVNNLRTQQASFTSTGYSTASQVECRFNAVPKRAQLINVAGFLLALLPVALAPGASLTLSLANASASGYRGVAKVVAGTALGILCHGAMAGFGISSLVAHHPAVLKLLKAVGLVYLLYLAIRLIKTGISPTQTPQPASQHNQVKDAFLLNLLNVKALLFYLSIVPIFAGNQAFDYVYLSVVHIAIMALWTFAICTLYLRAQATIGLAVSSRLIHFVGGLCLLYLCGTTAVSF